MMGRKMGMRSFIQGAFRNKAAVWLCVVLVLAMGTASYLKLPMEFRRRRTIRR